MDSWPRLRGGRKDRKEEKRDCHSYGAGASRSHAVTRAAFVLGSNGPDTLGRLKKLAFARDDAVRFARAISAIDVGFSIKGRTFRARDTIIKRFDELASALGPQDELIFYFAGHGLVSHGDLYLILDE